MAKTAKTKNVSAKAKRSAVAQKTKRAEPKRLSALDTAALVLAQVGQSMNCQELIVAMSVDGYWTSPSGRTPSATLYTALTKLPNLAP